ncbi:MAG: RDD family protein [Beijerinckiaceae bacterium]|nr:RDD family protein [Beijerinckiaceae bacterium]
MQPPVTVGPAFNVDGVRTRRIFAFCVDFLMILSLIMALFVVAFIFAIPTFGFSFIALFLALPALMPALALLYNGVTVSGPNRATIGMRMFDLKVTRRDGGTPGFLQAAAHAVLFYVPGLVILQPHLFLLLLLLLPTFFEADKRMLHDILLGLVVSRREPFLPYV